MTFPHLSSPLPLNGTVLPNRLVRAAAATNFGGSHLTQELIDFEVARARGGLGLCILGNASIHPTCPAPLNAYDDEIVAGYEQLMAAMKPLGTRVFQQLWHCGSSYPNPDGTAPWSCSPIPSPLFGVVPIEMTRGQIAEIIAGFASAARRCEAGGLDGVEVHGGHGYIFQQFLSPLTNTRADDYGGSFENRLSFTLEVLRAMRGAVSASFPIGIRLSSQGYRGGLAAEDLIAVVGALEAERLVDYINFSVGSYVALHKVLGPALEEPGYQIAPNRSALLATKIPRIVNGRFTKLQQVEDILAQDLADLVGMTRALIADPDLPRKTLSRTPERVRPCIACNEGCIAGMAVGAITCSVNPIVGRDGEFAGGLGIAAKRKKVLVAGAGPAGLEAARVAAERGHSVILCEAETRLGGQLAFARRSSSYRLLGDLLDWYTREIERLGVEVRLGSRIAHGDADAMGIDALIVATGSRPRLDGALYNLPALPVQGLDQARVVSSWQALAGPVADLGAQVVIMDETGQHEAVAVAMHVTAAGGHVVYVTTHSQFAPGLAGALLVTPALEFLMRGSFELRTRTRIETITPGGVVLQAIDGGKPEQHLADTIVLVSPNFSVNTLATPSPARAYQIQVIGDAISPRFLGTAIAEGFRAGMSL